MHQQWPTMACLTSVLLNMMDPQQTFNTRDKQMTGGADPGNLLKRRRRSNRAPDPSKVSSGHHEVLHCLRPCRFQHHYVYNLYQEHLIKLRAYILSFSSIHISLCLLLPITISFTVSFNVILLTGAAVALPSNRDDDGGIFNF